MLGDLIFVLKHIKRVFDTYGLLDLYVNFTNTLHQISIESNEDLQKAQKDYKIRIIEAHKELEPRGWSYSQLSIFDKFGAKNIVGNHGITAFLKALGDNHANTPGAIEEINILKNELTTLITHTDSVLSSLGNMEAEAKADPTEIIIQIVFSEKVAIENIVQQAKQIEIWKKIIRAFSLLAGTAPEKARIIAVSKNSPYTEWLGVGKIVGDLLTGFISACIEIRTKYLEMQKAALVLVNYELSIKGQKLALLEECDTWARNRVLEVLEQTVRISKIDGVSEADKNAALVELRKAGPDLYQHIVDGGQVDTSTPNNADNVFSNFQLQQKYSEIQQLNTEVHKLLTVNTETPLDQPSNSKINKQKVKK